MNGIFCICFACTVLLPLSVFSSGTDAGQPPLKRRVVASERFERYAKVKLPPSAMKKLKAAGIDPAALGKCSIPENCLIDFNTLPRDYRFDIRKKGFLVQSSGKITLLGPHITPTNINYVIEVTVSSPREHSTNDTAVELGVINYGLYDPDTRFIKTEKLAAGERKNLTLPIVLSDDFGPFRPALRVSGAAIFENIVVYESDKAIHGDLRIVEGTLEQCSCIPNPKSSDYPNCRFTCRFKGNAIFHGKSCPKELSLVLEGFANYKLLPTRRLKPGSKVICAILPFEKLPPERQTTQQADDLNLFSLESYYAVGVYKTHEFRELPGVSSSGIVFSGTSEQPYVSVFERRINPPLNQDDRNAVREDIAGELKKVDAMLRECPQKRILALQKAFDEAWAEEQKKDAPGRNRIIGNHRIEYVWRNIDNSFWALPKTYRLQSFKDDPIPPANLDALIALRDFLNANGCQLLVSPVPNSQSIAARVMLSEFRMVPDFQTAAVVRQLLKKGLWTFYPSDMLIRNFNRHRFAFLFPMDDHPADTTQDVMTDIVAKKLTRYGFHRNRDPKRFSVIRISHCYADNALFRIPDNCDIGNNTPESIYLCRRVLYDSRQIQPDPASPILVIGNSFMKTPTSFPDSFPTILSSKLNMGIDAKRVGAFGPMTTVVQQLFSSPEKLLTGKKVIVLAVGVNHLLANVRFNNIRQMDDLSKCMYGKNMLTCIQIDSNTDRDVSTQYPGLFSPNFVEIPQGRLILADLTIENCDKGKAVFVVIPTCLDSRRNHARYVINGRITEIPECSGQYSHSNAVCELPAGTTTLKIELVGTPGSVLSIRNIQIYQ